MNALSLFQVRQDTAGGIGESEAAAGLNYTWWEG
jgi:hypothetical protein